MKVFVRYIDFHADNHQGGQGQSFQFTTLVEVPDDLAAYLVKEHVVADVEAKAKKARPFPDQYENSVCIQEMIIL